MSCRLYQQIPSLEKTQQSNHSHNSTTLETNIIRMWHPKDCSGRWRITIQHSFKTLQDWCFQHIKSSPHHLQSNGLAEICSVKSTLIRLWPHKKIHILHSLVYQATAINHSLPSPAELLNSRKYCTLLPTRALVQREREERNGEIMLQTREKDTTTYTELSDSK